MDLYSVLWVDKQSSNEEIKKAYRKLAMQYHPDRNAWDKAAEEKFKEINKAYETLSDESKRKNYDMFWDSNGRWNPFGWWFSWWVDVDLWDIFESFFWWWFSWWKSRKRQTEFAWEDLEYRLNIDLKTSIFWGKQKINFNKRESCNTCNWEGWSGKKTCPKCNGKWQFTHTTQSMFWMIQQTVTCDNCNGSWETFENICHDCHWEKRKVIKKEIEVDIPAWIDEGMIIKMTGEWNHWIWTNKSWDLYIKFEVEQEEKWLKRNESDLHYELEIDIVEAVLWATKEVNIPIIWKRKIEIKAWTEHSNIIKISWDGIKHINNDKKWDLYIELFIKIPKKLSKKERDLFEEIAKERKIDVNKWWVFEKIFG